VTVRVARWLAGVADGVGGWRTYGVDPSQFPKSLMAACERMVHTGQFTPRSPVDVLSSGYQEIQQDKAPLIGKHSYQLAFHLPSLSRMIYRANIRKKHLFTHIMPLWSLQNIDN